MALSGTYRQIICLITKNKKIEVYYLLLAVSTYYYSYLYFLFIPTKKKFSYKKAFLVATTWSSHVVFAAPSNNYETKQNYKLCTTQECVDEASRILNYMDRTIDPCDNFYQFACGSWVKNNPANTSYPRISTMSIMSQKTSEQIKEILEDAPGPDDTVSLKEARKLYKMCMDIETLEKVGVSDLNNFVRRIGGWPLTMSPLEWEWKGFRIWQHVSDILQFNMFSNGLYEIAVSVDDKKSDTNVIIITEPNFFAPRDILIGFEEDNTEKMKYKSFIETVAHILIQDRGGHINPQMLSQDALDVVNFEIELAKLTLTLEDSRDVDKIYNPLTIQELQHAYDAQHPKKGKINWLFEIQKLFAREGIMIKSSEKLIVYAYKYLTSLVPLLERTPSRTIINYMQWTAIRELLPYTERTEQITVQITAHFKNESPELLRWKTCLKKSANLHTAISQEYAKRYMQQENKEDISVMVTDIADVIREQIKASTWMDEQTKKVSLEKLKSMRKQILIPDWFSNEAIDKYYRGIIITSEYFESAMNVFKFELRKMLSKLRKPVDKKWLMEPTIVNAYYNPSGNEIVIPIAITQNPAYDKNRPAFMNYGALGVAVGHEINHGFDNSGRKYDKDGNAIEWWTPETIKEYEKLAQCFVDQYNGYLVPGLEEFNIYVNGLLSLGENIGDSAGLVAAYYAYKNRKVRLNEPELRLQGLEEYSDDQVFFMGFAQVFCQNATPEQIRLLQLDEHPMPETRVRGSYSNFPEFAKAYNCPAGKGMNPDKRCALW